MAALVISYSRIDRPQVRAVVELLRTAFRDARTAVYWDGDLEPGDHWFEEIKQHIEAAPQLFVFWCQHSAGSQQVRREFVHALSCNKRVVPVLLDDTPLSHELEPIHGIDLRGAIAHVGAPPSSAPRPSARPRIALVVPAVLVTVLIIAAFSLSFGRSVSLPAGSGGVLAAAVALLVLAGLLALVVFRWRRRRHARVLERAAAMEEEPGVSSEFRPIPRVVRPDAEEQVIGQFARYLA